jgi:hypothetical protein
VCTSDFVAMLVNQHLADEGQQGKTWALKVRRSICPTARAGPDERAEADNQCTLEQRLQSTLMAGWRSTPPGSWSCCLLVRLHAVIVITLQHTCDRVAAGWLQGGL